MVTTVWRPLINVSVFSHYCKPAGSNSLIISEIIGLSSSRLRVPG